MLGSYYNSMAGLGEVTMVNRNSGATVTGSTNEEAVDKAIAKGWRNFALLEELTEDEKRKFGLLEEKPITPTGKSFFEKHKLKLIGGAALAGLAFFMFRR